MPVAVCGTSSRLVQVTFAPAVTVSVAGLNRKLSIVIRFGAADGVVVGGPASAARGAAGLSTGTPRVAARASPACPAAPGVQPASHKARGATAIAEKFRKSRLMVHLPH